VRAFAKAIPEWFPSREIIDKYIIPDKGWGTPGARIKDDAPQWAKDEWAAWRKEQEKDWEEGWR